MTDKTQNRENLFTITDVTAGTVAPLFAPRNSGLNKGDFGCAVVVGGSASYIGAPLFALDGAAKVLSALPTVGMLSGAGTSTLCVPDFLVQPLYNEVRFSALKGLCSKDGNIVFDRAQFMSVLPRRGAFLIGNGMADGEAFEIANFLLDDTSFNFVLDADGLKRADEIPSYKGRAVLTPHIGEFAKMTGLTADQIKKDSAVLCRNYAAEKQCVLVLKSDVTYISDGVTVFKNTSGNVKLAKGGSGDILGGIICGLLAFGTKPIDAACAGAYLLGRSAELSTVNEYSHMPTDTLKFLPAAIGELIK